MSVRIPIRKWEKVREPVFLTYVDYPGASPKTVRQPWAEDEKYRLEVMINGEILSCDIKVPALAEYDRDPRFREAVIAQMSRKIGAIIADEVRRSIV
jgi:hypothetical protein